MTYWERMKNFVVSPLYKEMSKRTLIDPVQQAASKALGYNFNVNVRNLNFFLNLTFILRTMFIEVPITL